ncbi:MAG: hypothetical protein RJP96_10735, partial [Algiphilus sp.]|uniref:hypothetical protein n=1 Tax=Algiphilus sp. TaxID=1872431 RepID=UPI0032ED1D80
TWYLGDTPGDAAAPGTIEFTANGQNFGNGSNAQGFGTASISGLAAGDYWVLVTDTSDPTDPADPFGNCSTVQDFTVTDIPESIVVVDVAVTPSNACNGNGSFTVNEITSDGASLTAFTDLDNYTFELLDASLAATGIAFTQGTTTALP